jgi:hypothetical protein
LPFHGGVPEAGDDGEVLCSNAYRLEECAFELAPAPAELFRQFFDAHRAGR